MLHVLHQKGRGDRESLPVIDEEDRRANETNGIRTKVRIQTLSPIHDRHPAKGMEDSPSPGMDGNGEPNGIDEGETIRPPRPSQMPHNRSGMDLVYLHPIQRITASQRLKMAHENSSSLSSLLSRFFTFITYLPILHFFTCLHFETALSEEQKTPLTISKTSFFLLFFTFITKKNYKDLEKRIRGYAMLIGPLRENSR